MTNSELSTYKKQIDQSIQHYCDRLLQQTEADFGPYSFEAMETYASLLNRGGKRLRGAMVMAAYKMVGGTDDAMIVEAARTVEMLNTNLLIFDDIADQSIKRRGGPTVHKMFETYHREAKLYGDSTHYGIAMALHVGLAGTYLVEAEIALLKVGEPAKLAASINMNHAIVTAVNGQLNDITNEAVRLVNEKQVERTLTWKSAYYTFLQPLQFGMLLAGSADAQLPLVRDYAMNLGLAFQITDDIIGTFGEESKSGKSSKDDLAEGKITILVSRALQEGTAEQKKTLLAALGNHKLTNEQHEACKQIMRDTGALEYARDMADTHAQVAIKALDQSPEHWGEDGINFLHDLATYVTSRQT
jgi:geranylgeranyl diphosphate synthase type I